MNFKAINQTLTAKHFLKLNLGNSTHSLAPKASRLHLQTQIIKNATAATPNPPSLSKLNPYGDFSEFEASIEQMQPILPQTQALKQKLFLKLPLLKTQRPVVQSF